MFYEKNKLKKCVKNLLRVKTWEFLRDKRNNGDSALFGLIILKKKHFIKRLKVRFYR